MKFYTVVFECEADSSSGYLRKGQVSTIQASSLANLYYQVNVELDKLNLGKTNKLWYVKSIDEVSQVLDYQETIKEKDDYILNRLDELETKFDEHIEWHHKRIKSEIECARSAAELSKAQSAQNDWLAQCLKRKKQPIFKEESLGNGWTI